MKLSEPNLRDSKNLTYGHSWIQHKSNDELISNLFH